ncbi:sensor histidine kinase, partial [Oceanidesulfovibrio marinus]
MPKQLLQSQKMEAIGALAGGIAHDFNNILTSIMNSAELALMDVEPDTDAGKDLERVIRAASRGKRLVQQIMAFSRPSQEGFQPTDLAEHVRDTVNLLKPSLKRNITVNAKVTAEPACVMVDPRQIYRVLMNLCT